MASAGPRRSASTTAASVKPGRSPRPIARWAMNPERAQRGFSLLEAIVALTILATVGMALFAAMSQSTQMVARAEDVRLADSALRNAAAWMASVNPAETPQGEQQLGDVTLRWSAELVEPMHDATTGYLQPGLYQVGLY